MLFHMQGVWLCRTWERGDEPRALATSNFRAKR